MKKRLVLLLIMGVVFLSVAAQAIQPRVYSYPLLSFDGRMANCSVTCRGDYSTDRVSATLSLYHGNALVDSWSGSGTYRVSVSGSCAVERGETYRLVLTWSVNGVSQPTEEIVDTCP